MSFFSLINYDCFFVINESTFNSSNFLHNSEIYYSLILTFVSRMARSVSVHKLYCTQLKTSLKFQWDKHRIFMIQNILYNFLSKNFQQEYHKQSFVCNHDNPSIYHLSRNSSRLIAALISHSGDVCRYTQNVFQFVPRVYNFLMLILQTG